MVPKELFGVGVDGIGLDKYCGIDRIVSVVVLVLNSIVVLVSVLVSIDISIEVLVLATFFSFSRMHQRWAKYSRYSYSSTVLVVLVLEGLVLVLVLEELVLVLVFGEILFEALDKTRL